MTRKDLIEKMAEVDSEAYRLAGGFTVRWADATNESRKCAITGQAAVLDLLTKETVDVWVADDYDVRTLNDMKEIEGWTKKQCIILDLPGESAAARAADFVRSMADKSNEARAIVNALDKEAGE